MYLSHHYASLALSVSLKTVNQNYIAATLKLKKNYRSFHDSLESYKNVYAGLYNDPNSSSCLRDVESYSQRSDARDGDVFLQSDLRLL